MTDDTIAVALVSLVGTLIGAELLPLQSLQIIELNSLKGKLISIIISPRKFRLFKTTLRLQIIELTTLKNYAKNIL